MSKIFVIRNSVVTTLLVAVLMMGTSVQSDTSQISALEVVKDADGSSSFVITKTGAIEIQEFMMDDPPRLVIDFIGATHLMTEMTFAWIDLKMQELDDIAKLPHPREFELYYDN